MFVCSMPGCPMTTAGCPRCLTGSFAQPNHGGYPPTTPPLITVGCICPPTSEQTCQAPLCPRKNPFGKSKP